MKIHPKSLLVGAFLCAVVFLVAAASETPSHAGKYQAAAGAGFAIILDTETGQAWGANLITPAPLSQNFQGIQPGFWDKKNP